jgi:hypothetical protein
MAYCVSIATSAFGPVHMPSKQHLSCLFLLGFICFSLALFDELIINLSQKEEMDSFGLLYHL